MKTFVRISLIVAFLVVAAATAQAQRVVEGTVCRKPAAGITVEVHRGGSMMTSFDGKYELTGDAKSKWIRFTFLNESKRVDLPRDTYAPFDYAFDGNSGKIDKCCLRRCGIEIGRRVNPGSKQGFYE